MTIYEALKFFGGTLERLEQAGVKPTDHKYIALFEDWQKARQSGQKVGYIVYCLAAKYQVSERTVYDVVRRFGKNCKPLSAE